MTRNKKITEIGPNGYALCIRGHEKTPENLSKHGKCRQCAIEASRAYYAANKEKVSEWGKQYNIINKDKIKEKNRKYREANSEKIAHKKKEYYLKNISKHSIKNKIYRERNKEKIETTKRRYYEQNRDKIQELRKKFQAENRERLAEKKKQYKDSNKEKVADTNSRSGAKYRANNREKITKAKHKYYQENKMIYRLQNQKRKALKKQVGGALSKGIAEKVLALQKGKCRICKSKLIAKNFHLDHIVPISKGGQNIDSNIQILCPTCNLSKGAKMPHEYAQKLGMLFL